MLQDDILEVYSTTEKSISIKLAEDVKQVYKDYACGISYKPDNVYIGVLLMHIKKYEDKLSAKFWDALAKNKEANEVYNAIANCTPKTCAQGFASFTKFHQFYFRFLFRMCHAKHLAATNNGKEFLAYLDSNEKIRRIIRPKFGDRIDPLFKFNTQVFKEGKKLLS